MDWIPVIKLGWWNAWIPLLIYPLQPYLLKLVDKVVGTGNVLQKMGSTPTSRKEINLNRAYMVAALVMLVYSIFLPMKVGTAWFFAGLAVFLAGLALLLAAMFAAAAAPQGRLFTDGVYRYSRHPMYLAILLIYTGVGIACASWLFLLLTAVQTYLMAAQVEIEERGCIKIFGEAYLEYMRATPKWLGIPRVLRAKHI